MGGLSTNMLQNVNNGVTPNGFINSNDVIMAVPSMPSATPNGLNLDEDDSVDDIENNEGDNDNEMDAELEFATPNGMANNLGINDNEGSDESDDDVLDDMMTKNGNTLQ